MKLWVGEQIEHLSNDFTLIRSLNEGLSKSQRESIELLVVNLANMQKIETLLDRLQLLSKSIQCHIIVITNNRYHRSDYPELEILPEYVAKIMIEDIISGTPNKILDSKKLWHLGNEKRKLPLFIIGALLCLEPVFKLLYLSITTEFPLSKVLQISTSADWMTTIEFWFIHPLAGIALMFPFGLSFVIFVSFHLYSVFTLLNFKQFTWPYISEAPHPSAIILITANCMLISFLLIPKYRKIFLGKTITLFRQHNRFHSNLDCQIICHGNRLSGKIIDYSSGGVQIAADSKLSLGDFVTLEVKDKIIPQVKVVRYTDKGTYGLCFYSESKKNAQADFDLLEYFMVAS